MAGLIGDEMAALALLAEIGRQECDGAPRPGDPPRPALSAAIECFGRRLSPWTSAGPVGPDSSAGDVARVVSALADACLPTGGWAVYGAERLVAALFGAAPQVPAWHYLRRSAIEMLRAHNVPMVRVPESLWRQYIEQGGHEREWLPFRSPPEPHEAAISPLGPDETRCLIRVGDGPGASRVLVRRDGPKVVALYDVCWEGIDRSLVEGQRTWDLYDLYLDIAWTTPAWDWADPDIEPFFPAPRILLI